MGKGCLRLVVCSTAWGTDLALEFRGTPSGMESIVCQACFQATDRRAVRDAARSMAVVLRVYREGDQEILHR